MKRWMLGVVLVAWVGACSGSDETRSGEPGSSAGATAPALTVPRGVPASAFAVAVVRSPWTLGEAATQSLFGPMKADIAKELRADLTKLFAERLGIDPLKVSTLTAFVMNGGGGPAFGLVASGVAGELRGTPVAEHAGVALYDLDGFAVALADGTVYLGVPTAVRAALDAAGGTNALAADSALAKLLIDGSEGALVAVAADATGVPDPGLQQLLGQFGATGAAVHLGGLGLRARVVASEAGAKQLEEIARSFLAGASAQVDAELAAARANPDGFEAAAVVVGAHHIRNALAQVVMTRDGGSLSARLPVEGADATMVVAVVGSLAAVAIPAFMKYIKKSKTSEARQLVKKMYDGARAYHAEHGSLPPSAPLTPANPTACCEKCAPDAGLWTSATWIDLFFSVDDPHYYAYEFVSDGRSQFTARAYGDLDCDGEWSTFEVYGVVGPDGISANPDLYRRDELE